MTSNVSDDELLRVLDEMNKYMMSPPSNSPDSKSVRENSKSPRETTAILDDSEPQRKEIEGILTDLLKKFQTSYDNQPVKRNICPHMDPLCATVQLLTDSLYQTKTFIFSLEPVKWLLECDRNVLYSTHLCSVSILRASVGYDSVNAPPPYPLPYGEYLNDIEALHLIWAHDLYNELRGLLTHIQDLEIKELHVVLLLMMIAFFTPLAREESKTLSQPEKVIKIHDYYIHKLQIYISIRYGVSSSPKIMNAVLTMIEKVRNFSARLHEFLSNVIQSGFQKEYKSICENIGLMAFLLQADPT